MAENAGTRVWSVLQLIQWSADYLSGKGFANGRLLAERLLAHVLQLRRVDLYLQFDRPLQAGELARYKSLFLRLAAHEPLQYLLGETEFMSLRIEVGPGVLIPRPETELLVEKALERARVMLTEQEGIRILDIGTGSGCIAIALASALPQAGLVAMDSSPAALDWARKNCAAHGLDGRMTLVEHDLAAPPLPEWPGSFDLVVANPPYIRRAEWAGLDPEIRDHEPRAALIGGDDGLEAYRSLAQGVPALLRRGGEAFVEIGDGMAEAVGGLFMAGFAGVELFHDLAGKERLVHLFSPGGNHE
ncbi:MAG TPA: peptide chain release factor N(5)-glutamine methyltransferase [bacterium]|nr:peptide chain release factor N(5)-glutamine methyltransferase [bacterium]HPR86423.1 peptide chain release factor N(5)-glutamine methyltransferase [bacterium]